MKALLTTLFGLFLLAGFAQPEKYNQVDSQGRKQGPWRKAYEGIQVYRYVGQFKDDKPIGKFVYYHESGNVEAVIQFWGDGKTSYTQMYHESGYMMCRGKYLNQERDSTWVYYDDRGIVSYQEDYKKGLLDGQKVIYYEPVNGQYRVMEYSYWKAGVQHGEYKKYHPNTNVSEEGTYVDGNKEGTVKCYHPNGRLMRLERYRYAVKHGFWVFNDEKGQMIGYQLYWEGVLLKGDAKKKKEEELKAKGEAPAFVP